jgi:hypothetical protein
MKKTSRIRVNTHVQKTPFGDIDTTVAFVQGNLTKLLLFGQNHKNRAVVFLKRGPVWNKITRVYR